MQNRKFGKVIRYHSRHKQASQRPRIKGQFVKQGTVIPDATGSGGTGVSNGEDYSSQMCDEDDEEVRHDQKHPADPS